MPRITKTDDFSERDFDEMQVSEVDFLTERIVNLVMKVGLEGGRDSFGGWGLGIEEPRRVGKWIEGRFTRKLKYDMISVNYDSTELPIDASNARKILKTLKTRKIQFFKIFKKKFQPAPPYASVT